MIERYTRKKMGSIWSVETRFQCLLDVEIAVAKVQAKHGIIPRSAAVAIAKKAKFKVSEILEIEKTTKHDIIAFVSNVASYVGDHGRFVHYGLTSSDALDTALSLQIRMAGAELLNTISDLDEVLARSAKKYAKVMCAGRTHGMHAEITSFGVKMSGFLAELRRAKRRLMTALNENAVGKLSGAVGTYTNLPSAVEAEILKSLKLEVETVATQVIPRDRHAALFSAIALFGGFLERLAVELRHLQRTEVGEVIEDFTPGQKGSSAMPHKKNPISAENITGASRLLRSYTLSSFENMALWHERDISHSSVERVIFPDAFILADYATSRMTELMRKLHVDSSRMKQNMQLSRGQLMSSQILLKLVDAGMSREDAYKVVQSVSHGQKSQDSFETALRKHPDVKKRIKPADIKKIFSGADMGKRFEMIVGRALKTK